ncbi:MAG: hypothetical protein H5U02_00435 [Clostridia bacterium]|nr:hypothetical protein [Clostridia bacterium]
MKIAEVWMRDFRNHAASRMELERVNIVVGANGAGKTSIVGAIEYALTGRCRWTDRRGAGAAGLIRRGAEEAEVGVKIGLGGGKALRVARKIPGGLAVEGWSGNASSQQSALMQKVGAEEDAISACLNTSAFLDLPAVEQQKMLFALAGVSFDQKAVVERMVEWLSERGAGEGEKERAAEAVSVALEAAGSGGPELFDEVEKILRERRKLAKRQAKEVKDALEVAKREMPVPPRKARAELEAEAGELERRREELISKRYESFGRYHQAKERVEVLKREIAALESRAQDEIGDVAGLEAEEAELSMRARDALAAQREAEKEEARLKAEMDAAAGLVNRLEAFDGWCPISNLACPAEKAEWQVMLDSARMEARAKRAEYEKAVKLLAARVAGASELSRQWEAVKERLEEARRQAESARSAEALLEAKKKELAAEEVRLRAFSSEEREQAAQEQIEVDRQLAEAREALAAWREWDAWQARLEGLKKQSVELEREAGLYEALVKAFGPDGIREAMLAEKLGPIEERINARLRQLVQGRFVIRIGADGIKVIEDGQEVKIDLLSRSERMRVGVAMQDALASLAGLGVMVIDDAEQLDPANRMALTNMLMGLNHETIIVLAARGEVDPADPGIPGLAVWVVEDGSIRRARRAAA